MFIGSNILKGILREGRTKIYILVIPEKSQLIIKRFAYVKDLKNFKCWEVKRKFKNKFLVYQDFAFGFDVLDKIINTINISLKKYEDF